MPTIITSAQVAAAYGLSAATETTVPLSLRLEEAVRCLQTMESCHAQGWYDLPQALRGESTERVFSSLKTIPEIVSKDEIRALETASADPRGFAVEVANLRAPLQQQLTSLRQLQDQAQTDQLLTMTQIVSGGRPFAGLPDVRSVVAYQSLPDWARRVVYKNGGERSFELNARGEGVFQPEGSDVGVEMAFQFGRFWVRDSRDPSLLDLRNLVRSGGVFVGTDAALRLKPGVSWPIAPGEAVRLGKKSSAGTLLTPRVPLLENLRAAIAVAPSLGALSKLLRDSKISEVADQIDRFQKDKSPFDRVPPEGGLAVKIQELVLKAEFYRLHQTYMPRLSEGMVGPMFRSLALAIQNANSAEELVNAVRTSPIPGASSMAEGIALFISKPNKSSIKAMTEDFGLRERVVFFSKQAAAQLQKDIESLGRQVAGLTGNLESTRSQLADKTAALQAAEQTVREQLAQMEAENTAREGERQREKEERERLAAEHAHTSREKDERHHRERDEQDARHRRSREDAEERARLDREDREEEFGAEKDRLEREKERLAEQMTILEGARAQLQREKEMAETAVAKITTQIELAREDVKRLDGDLEAARTEIARLEGSVGGEQFKYGELEQKHGELQKTRLGLESTLAEAKPYQGRYEREKTDRLALIGEKVVVDAALDSAKEELERIGRDLEDAKAEAGRFKDELASGQRVWLESMDAEQQTRAKVEAENVTLSQHAGRAEDLEQQLLGAREDLARLERELTSLRKPAKGEELKLGQSAALKYGGNGYVVGRGGNADIRLDGMHVSRSHFQIRCLSSSEVLEHDSRGKPKTFKTSYLWEIKDRSEYGTRVNGVEVQGWQALPDGAVISLGRPGGETRLTFLQSDPQSGDAKLVNPIYQTVDNYELQEFVSGHAVTPDAGVLRSLFGKWKGPSKEDPDFPETAEAAQLRNEVLEAVSAFARLLANVHELRGFFSPEAIAAAKAAGKELALFERAEETITNLTDDRNTDEFRTYALGDLEVLKVIEPLFEDDLTALWSQIFEMKETHAAELETLFGIESENAAYVFAVLQKNVPEVASGYTPQHLWETFQKDGKKGVGVFFKDLSQLLDPQRHMTGRNRYEWAADFLIDLHRMVGSPQRVRASFRSDQPPLNGKFFTMGSGDESDSQIVYPGKESLQIAIYRDPQHGWCIAEMGQSGIFLNGQPAPSQKWHVITEKTRVQFGDLLMEVTRADNDTLEITQVNPRILKKTVA